MAPKGALRWDAQGNQRISPLHPPNRDNFGIFLGSFGVCGGLYGALGCDAVEGAELGLFCRYSCPPDFRLPVAVGLALLRLLAGVALLLLPPHARPNRNHVQQQQQQHNQARVGGAGGSTLRGRRRARSVWEGM